MRLPVLGGRAFRHATLVVFCLLALVPLYYMLTSSFKTEIDYAGNQLGPPSSWTWANFQLVITHPFFVRWMFNSLLMTVTSVGLAVVISTLAAYALVRMKLPARNFLFRVIASLIAVPVVALIIPLFQLMVNLQLIDTYASVIVIYVGLMVPYTTFFLAGFFRQLPASIFEAAILDNCGHLRLLRHVVVPLSGPALATLAVVNALWAWNELLVALVMLQDDSLRTLMVGLTVFQNEYTVNVPATMAGLVISLVPIAFIYVGGLRYFVSGLLIGSTQAE